MNSKILSDFLKPTIISGQQYGTKISVEIDHSDTDIDELFDAFKTLVVGLGYSDTTWKQCIIERGDEYREEEQEILQSQKDAETFFNAITNPDEPTREAIKGIQDFMDGLDGLSEKQIDEALAEHNAHEEGYNIDDYVEGNTEEGYDVWGEQLEEQYWKNEGKEYMPPGLEEQFWKEQPPEPFATPEEVEKYGIDDKFDDYGQRKPKEQVKVGRRGVKKK